MLAAYLLAAGLLVFCVVEALRGDWLPAACGASLLLGFYLGFRAGVNVEELRAPDTTAPVDNEEAPRVAGQQS